MHERHEAIGAIEPAVVRAAGAVGREGRGGDGLRVGTSRWGRDGSRGNAGWIGRAFCHRVGVGQATRANTGGLLLFLLARALAVQGGLLDGLHEQRRFVGKQESFDAHQAGCRRRRDDIAIVVARQGLARIGRQPLGGVELAADGLHLAGGGDRGVLQQSGLVGRSRDAGDGTHLGVRQLAGGEGCIHFGERGERAGHAKMLAGGGEPPPDAVGEPVSAGGEALGQPAARFIEAPQVGEQAVHGGIEVHGLLGDLLTERDQLFRGRFLAHEDALSRGFQSS
jgi:hypothetical protein